MRYFLQQVVNGLQLGFVYAIISLGYTMIYGIAKLINFAHADVFMVGAFLSYYAITRFHLGFLPATLISAVGCAILGVIIERIAYKPLRNAPRVAVLVTALAMSIFLEYFTALGFVFGPDYITYK
ncbi:MAG: branched-chain amino acid ABC transporter permease, partial [Chloroflexota bacterium]|nr:branched-chain amino acid ABC transporter permease [Chloroflexota bacterium]